MKDILCIASIVFVFASVAFSQCTKDMECKGNRVCVNGECVESAPGTSTAAAGTSVPLGAATLYVHPLGFVQFGPLIGLEFRANDGLTIDVHWRYAKLGFTYAALVQALNPDETKDISFGAMGFGSQVRYYFPLSRRAGRPYFGGMFEYSIDKGTTEKGEDWESTYDSRQMVFCATGGYRYRIGTGFNMTLGLMAGCAFGISNEWSYTDQVTPYNPSKAGIQENDPVTIPFAMLELGIGWEFGRGK
jgi:opacity protein-like surface antigen